MKNIVLTVAFLCALFSNTSVEAKRHKHPPKVISNCVFFCESTYAANFGGPSPVEGRKRHPYKAAPRLHFERVGGIGPRPGKWCGWFMQHETGVTSKATGRNLNRAIEWRHVGRATSAGIGAIVVWANHVGKIIGGSPGKWIVRSGNDGRAVRERVRSVANAVAFRAL